MSNDDKEPNDIIRRKTLNGAITGAASPLSSSSAMRRRKRAGPRPTHIVLLS